jgi:cell division septum initiation protein DivIVA
MELLEHSRTEVLHLYETAIAENERLSQEIHKLREELEAAKGGAQYKVDINRLIG